MKSNRQASGRHSVRQTDRQRGRADHHHPSSMTHPRGCRTWSRATGCCSASPGTRGTAPAWPAPTCSRHHRLVGGRLWVGCCCLGLICVAESSVSVLEGRPRRARSPTLNPNPPQPQPPLTRQQIIELTGLVVAVGDLRPLVCQIALDLAVLGGLAGEAAGAAHVLGAGAGGLWGLMGEGCGFGGR